MSTASMRPDATIRLADYNPLLPHVREDPFPYYRVLRDEAPVHQVFPGVPLFAVSRYEDVVSVLHRPEVFSSTALALAAAGAVGFGPNTGALAGHRLLAAPMMISVDPPDHGRLRGLVNRGFTPRRIATLEPRLREIAEGLVDRVAASGSMDLVKDLATPFPVTVIAELLGVEAERRDQFKQWSDALVIGLSGVAQEYSREDVRGAADELADYLGRVAAERRVEPRDDLMSVLVAAEGGQVLSDDEVLAFALLLLIAGNETTTNLIGNAAKALLRAPEQLGAVQDDPARIPAMLEEALRYDSPIQGIPRCALRDVEIAGRQVPKDAFVMVLFGSANRDERQFPDPDRFDVGRDPQGHVAFGHGIHFCLGAALARLEARVAFEVLLSRCGEPRLAAEEVPMVDSMLLRGPKSLPLRFEPR